MANETRTVEVTELVNSELINPLLLEAAQHKAKVWKYLLRKNVSGATAVSFPRKSVASSSGTVQVNVSESAEIAATAWETTQVSITPTKYAYRVDLSREALEDNILNGELSNIIMEDMANQLAVAFDNSIVDLFPGFTDSVGSGSTDLTVANMVQASAEIMANGMSYGPGELVYVLSPTQYSHLMQADAASVSTTIGSYFRRSDDVAGANGAQGQFMSHDVVVAGGIDILAGAHTGACFIRGDLAPTRAALAMAVARDISFSALYHPEWDETRMVTTARWAAGIVNDDAGCEIATDET